MKYPNIHKESNVRKIKYINKVWMKLIWYNSDIPLQTPPLSLIDRIKITTQLSNILNMKWIDKISRQKYQLFAFNPLFWIVQDDNRQNFQLKYSEQNKRPKALTVTWVSEILHWLLVRWAHYLYINSSIME